jgi:hypothetical protein
MEAGPLSRPLKLMEVLTLYRSSCQTVLVSRNAITVFAASTSKVCSFVVLLSVVLVSIRRKFNAYCQFTQVFSGQKALLRIHLPCLELGQYRGLVHSDVPYQARTTYSIRSTSLCYSAASRRTIGLVTLLKVAESQSISVGPS